jgi:hypothetical protein
MNVYPIEINRRMYFRGMDRKDCDTWISIDTNKDIYELSGIKYAHKITNMRCLIFKIKPTKSTFNAFIYSKGQGSTDVTLTA